MSGDLNPNQRKFVDALLDPGVKTIAVAAARAGVTERTGYTYVKAPNVKAALREAQGAHWAALTQAALNVMNDALDALVTVFADADELASARVSAARAVLDHGSKLWELNGLADRVTEIEQQLAHTTGRKKWQA